MSSPGTTKTVVVALGTHSIDCAMKFFGFALTGSASLLLEPAFGAAAQS